jgi:hypothetical protein
MARSTFDWEHIRAEYEAGASQSSLSQKYGPSRKAIQNHIAAEKWSQDCEPAIQRLAAEKVAGIVAGGDPQKKAEALDRAAMRRADVEIRHCTEWEEHQSLFDNALADRDFELAKLAKITAETLKIRQEGERKAWRIDSVPMPSPTMNLTLNNVQNAASPEEIKRLLAEEKAGNEIA